jgi:hypothetical protein
MSNKPTLIRKEWQTSPLDQRPRCNARDTIGAIYIFIADV